MELVHPLAQDYAAAHTSNVTHLLHNIAQYTKANHPKHHMLTEAVQGQLLTVLSTVAKPTYVLEIGTFTGYGTICLAQGCGSNAHIHTIELRAQDAATAQQFINQSIFTNQISLHVGHALNIIPTLPYTWDMVYIDADKVNYSAYYDLILPKLNKGGIILADNVLFHGEVLSEQPTGKNAIAIHAFNQKIKNDASVHHVLLTVRDGLMIIVKK